MPISRKHSQPGRHDQTSRHGRTHRDSPESELHRTPGSSELPSSPGDSPKRVMPSDVTPEHAAWKDLKVSDVGSDRCYSDVSERPSAGARGSDTASGEELPSSHGDSPQEMTPKDVGPEHASWSDASERKIASRDAAEREEALIDEASELSFPASDPPAEFHASGKSRTDSQCDDEFEEVLDEAIDMTFPASDPIAVTSITRILMERTERIETRR